MKTKLILLSSLLFVALSTFSQTSKVSFSDSNLQENKIIEFKLNDNNTIEDTSIVVNDGTKSMQFKFNISLNTGAIKIEIYSPDGKKEEKDMIIDTKYSFRDFENNPEKENSEKTTTGNFVMVKKNPQAGKWKVRIVPLKAKGNITINYSYSI